MSADNILAISGLEMSVRTDAGLARILNHVDLTVPRGKIVGVVGESGCGKSTLLRAMLGMTPRGARITAGHIDFDGEDILAMSEAELTKRVRGSRIGLIPQDPYLALNPLFRVGEQLVEIMIQHGVPEVGIAAGRRDSRAVRRYREHLVGLLKAAQVPDPEGAIDRYPHQFSGGQRQRLLIAAALACRPQMVIADEPTTALDVTTQFQILKLLKKLTEESNISMVFVSHDFGVVAQICDLVTVMYAGQTVEHGATSSIIDEPAHPYTRLLIGCHPDRSETFTGIPGAVPSPISPPGGCRFNPRCPHARPVCKTAFPPRRRIPETGQEVACVLYDEKELA
jgi:oligopeptide/dipeptide ABC transporter ATP-binding protein